MHRALTGTPFDTLMVPSNIEGDQRHDFSPGPTPNPVYTPNQDYGKHDFFVFIDKLPVTQKNIQVV